MSIVLETGTSIFNTGEKVYILDQQHMLRRAEDMVHVETQWPQRENRQVFETEANTIRKCQNVRLEAIAIRQYVNRIPEAELPKWVYIYIYATGATRLWSCQLRRNCACATGRERRRRTTPAYKG